MTHKSQETENTTHNVSHDLKQEKFGVDNINHDMNKTNSGVYKIQIYVRNKLRLQRQNLRKRKTMGVYNVKIYVREKKSAFTTSKFT